ncbi:MAG: TetR/AcrR family transcriptional regulator [Aureliella sp.]
METMTRKQREIQDREKKILTLARSVLTQEGFQALSMDRLAADMEYAKGTLYNHFPHKEEIVAALAVESLELRREMMERASMLVADSRMKMMAIGAACELYAGHCQEHFAVELMLRDATIWDKSSKKRQELVRGCELRAMSIVAGVVRDAVASSNLELPSGMTAEELVFGFWSLTFGSHVLANSSPSLPEIGIRDAQKSIRYHGWTLMNGYNWTPLVSFEETDRLMDDFGTRIIRNA